MCIRDRGYVTFCDVTTDSYTKRKTNNRKQQQILNTFVLITTLKIDVKWKKLVAILHTTSNKKEHIQKKLTSS